MEYPYQPTSGGMPQRPPVEDHKTLAIVALVLSIVLCCNIPALGCAIYALIQANDVQKLSMQPGDQFYIKAQSCSKNAKTFSYIAIGLDCLSFVVSMILNCTGAMNNLIEQIRY
jgi:hypothetical protein